MIGGLRARLAYLRRRRRRLERIRNPGPVNEDNVALSLDMESDSRTLLLAFGGLNMGIGLPPFEFLSLTGELPVKRLFIRDLRQAWYHRGIPGYGETLTGAADSLRVLLSDAEVERLIVAGASAGGYAALAYGALLGAETVLSFAPQTVIDLDVLASIGDHRWDENLAPVFAEGSVDRAWIDLRAALPAARRAATTYRIYYDQTLAVDRRHAERLNGLQGVRLYPFGRGDHYLVRELRDSGALESILQRALS